MFSLARGAGGFPAMVMALSLCIWGISGRPAMAQGGGLGGGAGAGVGGGQSPGGIDGVGTTGPLASPGVRAGDPGVPSGPGVPDTAAGPGYAGATYGAPGAYGVPSGGAGYGGAAYQGYGPAHGGAVSGGYGPAPGTFGLGYPGFGLDYVHGSAMASHRRHYPRGLGDGNWCTYVRGKECLYPYVVDPYSDPAAALGFWPPYSAPVASPANVAGRSAGVRR